LFKDNDSSAYDPIQENTDEKMNERIDQQTERNIAYFAGKGRKRIAAD
jgi:hypothetical protein